MTEHDTDHKTWVDEVQVGPDGAGAWQATCERGWRGTAFRFDAFDGAVDPAQAACDRASLEAERHQSPVDGLRLVFESYDRQFTAAVRHGMALRDASDHADTVQRKITEASVSGSLATLSAALVQALSEARERCTDQQFRLSELTTDAYQAWKQARGEAADTPA